MCAEIHLSFKASYKQKSWKNEKGINILVLKIKVIQKFAVAVDFDIKSWYKIDYGPIGCTELNSIHCGVPD